MSARGVAQAVRLFAALLLVAAAVTLSPLPRTGTEGAPAAAAGVRLADLAGVESAARAARDGDCQAARELAPASGAGEAPVLLAGLYALECGRPSRARELLTAAGGDDADLEDLRLYALAEAATAAGDPLAALATADLLVERFPASPLSGPVRVVAAEAASRGALPEEALTRIDAALAADPGREARRRLAARGWDVAVAAGERELLERVGRRLLVDEPLLASEVRAVELFRRSDGRIPWSDLLTAGELARRAENLLAVGLPDSAAEMLREIPETARDMGWELHYAEALIAAHRGAEALARLEGLGGSLRGAEAAEAEWLAARAALDAAELRRGRRNLGRREREEMAAGARRLLASVAARVPSGPVPAAARALLLAELVEEDEVEAVLTTARELAAEEPASYAGASALWRLGWRRLERGDADAALALFGELESLFPESSLRRAATYWTARALEQAGRAEESAEVFGEIAASRAGDFYRRQAEMRSASPVVLGPETAVEPWPRDSRLERAELLSDLGLDRLALTELDALGEGVEYRPRFALRARILARQGEPRSSIQMIRRAFPQLGTDRQYSAPPEALRLYYPLEFEEVIREQAEGQALAPALVLAMIRQESAFDAGARSSAGARGLMQLLPSTGRELARRFGLPFHDARLGEPDFSVRLGTAYFRQVLEMFDRSEELALAGYNAGPYRIRRLWRRAGRDPEIDRFVEGLPLAETRSYVKRVILFSDSYTQLYG